MDRARGIKIRQKAMLIAVNEAGTAHAVVRYPPTAENPCGFHRLIGGGVESGETHEQAILRDVQEELVATIVDLTFLATVDSIFTIDGIPSHETIALYTGRLAPEPAPAGATLTESDGSVVPVFWRRLDDDREPLPLYPAAARVFVTERRSPADASSRQSS